jgi:hypothetical protein
MNNTHVTAKATASLLGPEFDDFLFAPIGEEKNGMMLRVVSALARLDLDPWEETGNLARLTADKATARLAALIAAQPDGLAGDQDPTAIASRLISRLPFRPDFDALSAKPSAGNHNPTTIQSPPFLWIVFLLMVLFESLGFAGSQRSAAHINNTPALTATGTTPQSPSLAVSP